MIAPDDDRGTDGTGPDELVEGQPGPSPLAVPEPADPGGQPLERDPLVGHRDPSVKAGVVGEQFEDRLVGAEDVGGIARQRCPPERPAALAELRPDEGRDEARVVECVRDARLERLCPQVVAVVEDDGAGALKVEHRPNVVRHRAARTALVLIGLGRAQELRIGERDLGRDIASEGVVGGGLVGDEIEVLSGSGPRRLDLGCIPDERDRGRFRPRRGVTRPCERLARVVREPVDVADLESAAGACLDRLRSRGRPRRSSSPRAAARRPCHRVRPSASRCPRSDPPKCWRAASANVSYVPWRMPWVPM